MATGSDKVRSSSLIQLDIIVFKTSPYTSVEVCCYRLPIMIQVYLVRSHSRKFVGDSTDYYEVYCMLRSAGVQAPTKYLNSK